MYAMPCGKATSELQQQQQQSLWQFDIAIWNFISKIVFAVFSSTFCQMSYERLIKCQRTVFKTHNDGQFSPSNNNKSAAEIAATANKHER